MQGIFIGYKFERETNFYKKIGVHQFKKIVPFGDFWLIAYNKLFGEKLKIVNSRKMAIIWLLFTLSVEFLHFITFVIILWFTIKSAINADYYKLFEWTGINIFVNLYPLMIQRYNRVRILNTFKITWSDIESFTL